MKKILPLLLFAFIYKAAAAQGQLMRNNNQTNYTWHRVINKNIEPQIQKLFNDAQFIFEGNVIASKEFITADKKRYTSYKIQIKNIFRGNLNNGTIELLRENEFLCHRTDYDNGIILLDNPDHSYLAHSGIYFCTPAQISSNGNVQCIWTPEKAYNANESDFLTSDNSIKVTPIRTLTNYSMPVGYGEILRFNSNAEIYQFLKKFGANNISIPETIQEEIIFQSENNNLIEHEKRIKFQNEFIQRLQEKLLLDYKIAANKTAAPPCKEIFISEYVDGPNKNKVLELYNPSNDTIDLIDYSILIFQNGAPTPLKIFLTGKVAPKETHVVTHPQADPQILAKANQTDNKMNFDGNDAVVLNKGTSTYVDKIGEIGVNPGINGWQVTPNGSTKAKDLRRKYPVDQGETDWNNGKNQWNYLPPDSVQNIKQHQNVCSPSSTTDISFTFANPQQIGGFFEFDIMVSANKNSTYFANCLFRIKYDTSAFGSNISQNIKVTVTKGTAYNSASYIDPNVTGDFSSSVLAVVFGDDYNQTSWNRTQVTTNPTQFLHFKIAIKNCNTFTNINFTDTSFTNMFSSYFNSPTEDALSGNILSYDNTFYGAGINQQISAQACVISISAFTTQVYAGTYYAGTPTNEWKLTINGNGFGSTKGNGNVYLLDADTDNVYLPLNAKDILIWSDSQIEIRMPSVVDSFSINGIAKKHTPASGQFYVKNNSGDSAITTSAIDIPYGIKNGIDPNVPEGKLRADLVRVNKNDSIIIKFKLGTSIANHTDPRVPAIVKRAIKDWRCEGLVYFVVDDNSTATNSAANDGISVIFMTNTVDPNNPNVIGQTSFSILNACDDANGNKHFFPTDIDIALSLNAPWFFDTMAQQLPSGQNDFYEVMLHEIGHAALLTHTRAPLAANNSQELMHWQALTGPVSGNSRRYITTDAQLGALDVVSEGELLNLNTSSCNSVNIGSLYLPPDQACGSLGIPAQFFKTADFSIYPNPSENYFHVDFTLERNANVQFTIYDFTGKAVQKINKQHLQKGNHQENFNIENLNSGIYFFIADINGQLRTMKIIKM